MASVSIALTGNALSGLKDLEQKIHDLNDPLDEIGAFLDSDVVYRFTQEQAPDGSKWQQSQSAKDRGGLTLTDNRNLADSVTHNVIGNNLEHGLDEVYSAIHHFGGKTGRNHNVNLPARPIIGIGDEQRDEIENIISDWLI